jgi:geranylgeranyl diphosphate synthase type II
MPARRPATAKTIREGFPSDISAGERRTVPVKVFLEETAKLVEEFLDRALLPAGTYPPPLADAMRYSVFAGGKKLRPALAVAASDCLGGERTAVLPVAAALEMIHTYSLIHDDLPAMDNDEYRRGKPTCHRQFGEAAAILAGDALLTQAFSVVAGSEALPAERNVRIVCEIAAACGPEGLIGGQVADLNAAGNDIELPALEYIHTHKTGALLLASVRCGAIAAGGDGQDLKDLGAYGRRVGLGFQIVDDILDIEGDPAETGKATGRDHRHQKATYPALFGIEYSRQRARELVEEALDALRRYGPEAESLRGLARFIEERSH